MATATATEETWEAEVLGADVPVLVDFWAEWCGPCRKVAPILEEIAGERGETVKIVKLNVEEQPGISRRYNVLSIPTLLLFNKGEIVDQSIGLQPKRAITSMIDKAL
jgi:thioredoxin 1